MIKSDKALPFIWIKDLPMPRTVVYELAQRGQLELVRIGRRTYVTTGSLERLTAAAPRLAWPGGAREQVSAERWRAWAETIRDAGEPRSAA